MVEALAFILAKSFATFLFGQYFAVVEEVSIEGAPSWYYQQEKDEVCSFSYAKGGLETLDNAQGKAAVRMLVTIQNSIDTLVYEKFKDQEKKYDSQERELISHFQKDPDLPIFVKSKLRFQKLEYKKKLKIAFAKACIKKETLIGYEKKRLQKLVYAIGQKKAVEGFDELEEDTSKASASTAAMRNSAHKLTESKNESSSKSAQQGYTQELRHDQTFYELETAESSLKAEISTKQTEESRMPQSIRDNRSTSNKPEATEENQPTRKSITEKKSKKLISQKNRDEAFEELESD